MGTIVDLLLVSVPSVQNDQPTTDISDEEGRIRERIRWTCHLRAVTGTTPYRYKPHLRLKPVETERRRAALLSRNVKPTEAPELVII